MQDIRFPRHPIAIAFRAYRDSDNARRGQGPWRNYADRLASIHWKEEADRWCAIAFMDFEFGQKGFSF